MPLIRLVCDCGASARVQIRDDVPSLLDKRAIAIRAIKRHGWKYAGGRVGKSVVTCVCNQCVGRDELLLTADYIPHETAPGTFEGDLALALAPDDDQPTSSEDTSHE